MKIIILSGGSGKRLWPLSNETRSKQFLKLLRDDNGKYESMIQRVYRQLNQVIPGVEIIVATGENQKDVIENQLGNKVHLVLEPIRRDTFPAIMLSTAYLAYERKVDLDETVIVLPVDPYAEPEYFQTLTVMDEIVQNNYAEMVLMGIKPTYPSEKYGYIIADQQKNGYIVRKFCEKPSLKKAESLLQQGAFWNGGVFAFKLKYAINILQKHMRYTSYKEIYVHYSELKKISFDYEVVEKADNIHMVLYTGYWKDLGTWNTLTDRMEDTIIGDVVIGEETQDSNIINELNIPIMVLGAKNLVVAASPDGILVSDKEKSSFMRPYVEQIDHRPMFEEYGWGDYKVLDYKRYRDGICSLIKDIYIRKGENIPYQLHKMREETWIIVDGMGRFVLNQKERAVERGDVLKIKTGEKHAIIAVANLHLIEIQIGQELTEEDAEYYDWKWL